MARKTAIRRRMERNMENPKTLDERKAVNYRSTKKKYVE